MLAIREYNVATGHVETLCVVADDETAQSTIMMLRDDATDHVIYAADIDSE